ncbi:hypothetical protein [Gillisia limnaea]|uniref:Uncharacterized protein n=1 Tax=Gillisia limnaea (strain DSM 15749 / LMG 21470 / R-8282) TaxID=865937 RepID=H2BT16_GILLR|nr:hypothetical protein [Gillisia limnaea]EHQ02574.1 hypothetical protein Gilli_1933 [Gillisia limnaea DSM 15749]
MDTSSVIIGLLLMLVFVGPILYMILNQSNKNKNRLKNLKNLGSQNNMNLDQMELTNSLLLGLDSKSKKLIIVEPKNNMQYDIIDLCEINQSLVSKKALPQVNGQKENTAITHISLDLFQKHPKETRTEIIFYDEYDDTSYNAETQLFLANKWDKLIKSNFSA